MATPAPYGVTGIFERGKSAFLDVFEKLFQKGDNSAVGIDVGSSSIKVIQVKKRAGKAVLETYGEIALGPYAGLDIGQATNLPAEKVSEALGDILKEANVTAKQGGIAIPLASSLLSVIEVPRVSERQLAEMIPIEARRYIPVPISEVTLDWRIIPEYEKGAAYEKTNDSTEGTPRKNVKVLIAAIHNEVMSTYERIAMGSGVAIDFLEVEAFSIIRALLGRERTATLILDIGAATTKVVVAEHGLPARSHIINRGSQDITQSLSRALGISILKAEELKREKGLEGGDEDDGHRGTVRLVLQSIFTEAENMLLSYEQQYHTPVGKVILSGGGALLKGILPFASKHFDTEVVHADAFTKAQTPAFMEAALKEAGPNFAVAMGIALRKLQEIE